MNNYLSNLKEKLKKKFDAENIDLIDNTNKHFQHKTFEQGKYHLKLIISSKNFKNINIVNAHKSIMTFLKDDLKNKIHAIQIVIK